MKNLHLIQTDKPSRLFDDGMQLYLGELEDRKGHPVTNYNIYITNSEEIKEGDWFIQVNTSKRIKHHSKNGFLLQPQSFDKKIILTTDQDLIKDGVQAITNTFAEWFVKNPNCEEVEVGYGWIRLTETDNEGYWVSIPDKQFEMQQEEPKQETLEEAAEINSEKHHYAFGQQSEFYQLGFIEGAKRQAERMYSEEEVRKIAEDAYSMGKNNILIGVFNKWFEQFKKK